MGKGTENGQADDDFNENISKDYQREILNNIAYWIKRRKKTQADLGKRISDILGRDITSSTLSRYKNATRFMPLDVFFAISKVLRVSPNDLAPKETILNTTTQNSDQIKSQYEKLNAANKTIISYLIEVLYLQQNF